MVLILIQGPISKYIQQIRATGSIEKQLPIGVEVTSIVSKQLPKTITMAGTINSERSVSIKPEVRGRIVYVKEPGPCNQGDLIIKLDDSSQQASLMKANATYLESKDQYDRGINRKQRKESISEAELASLKYRMESNFAEVKKAESDLSRMSLVAAFPGIVGVYKSGVSIGAVAMENQDLVSVSSGDKAVYFNIPEELLHYVQPGNHVFVKSSAFDGILKCEISALDSKSDSVHSIQVVAKLPKDDSLSFPSGFSAKVIIQTSQPSNKFPAFLHVPHGY